MLPQDHGLAGDIQNQRTIISGSVSIVMLLRGRRRGRGQCNWALCAAPSNCPEVLVVGFGEKADLGPTASTALLAHGASAQEQPQPHQHQHHCERELNEPLVDLMR